MTEQEALARFGAKDWRSLNKGQIMSFLFDIAPNLNDEITLKILEYAPDILNAAKTALSEYHDTLRKALETNRETTEKILEQNHAAAGAVLKSLYDASEKISCRLDDPQISPEDKQFWSGELFKYIREMRDFDEKNKEFLLKIDSANKEYMQNTIKYALIALLVVGGTLSILSGGKLKLPGKV